MMSCPMLDRCAKEKEYQRIYYRKHHPNPLTAREAKLGSRNPNWKGDNITVGAGRTRAYRWFPCPKGHERHHIDGNPKNNDPSNIKIVTPREHRILDGRMAKFTDSDRQRRNLVWVKSDE